MDTEVAELIEYIALYHSPNEDGTIVYNMDSTQEERFLDLIPGSLISGSPTTVTLLIGSYFEFLRTGNTKKVYVITKLSCGTSKHSLSVCPGYIQFLMHTVTCTKLSHEFQ